MNRKDLAQIKRRLKSEKSNIGSIVGCCVTDEKKIASRFDISLSLTSDEEVEKLFSLLKKTLSGIYGRNLYDVGFTNAQVTDSEEHKLLTTLRSSGLKDEQALEKLYEKIIGSLLTDSEYIILLASDRYDLFSVKSDGTEDKEESTETFSYFLCVVCPLKETKPVLAYDKFEKKFKDTRAEAAVGSPICGFMFPAFEERKANIYNTLFYTGDCKDNHPELLKELFGQENAPVPAAGQKATFGQILQQSVTDGCDYATVREIQEHICDIITEHKDSKTPEPLLIDKATFCSVLKVSGVADENINAFSEKFDGEFGPGALINPNNIVNTASIEVKTPEALVKIDTDFGQLVETRVIDGSKYIMIRADSGVEVNGVNVKIDE